MSMRRRVAGVLVAAGALLCALVIATPASAATWSFESLDGFDSTNGRTTDNVGNFNIAAVWNGQPHVWYLDLTTFDLRHAWWNGAAWSFEVLDGNGGVNGRTTNNVGFYGSVTIWNNQPHVWYLDGSGLDLRHAWWNGQAWYFETLDGQGGINGRTTNAVGEYSTVTIWNGQPHVWYEDTTGGDLRHAWWNGQAWYFETLDGQGGINGRTTNNVGRSNVVAVWNGQPHVWFYDISIGDLRHAWWNGQAWFFETLDGQGGINGRTVDDVGASNSVAVWNNQPHVWYWNSAARDLRHAWWNGAAWYFEDLDGAGGDNGRTINDVGSASAVAIWQGQPHVWYFDNTGGDLRHAWWNGAAWSFETLDGIPGTNGRTTNRVGFSDAAIIWNDQPHVLYQDSSAADVRHAWYG